jgi:exportin-7
LSFFNLLDELTREQLMSMASISPEAFLYLMQACEQGVESSDTLIRDHASSAIFNVCSFVIKEAEKVEREAQSTSDPLARRRSSVTSGHQIPGNHWMMAYLRQFPQTLPTLFSAVFNLVLFDNSSDKWSLSRSLYGLMMLQKEYVVKYIDAVINQQLPERKAFVTTVS